MMTNLHFFIIKAVTKEARMNNSNFLDRHFYRIVFILCEVLLAINALSVSNGPFVYFDQDYIQIGLIRFVPSDNNAVGSHFDKSYSVTLKKMNRILPNSYALFYGYREIDFITHTLAEGSGGFAISAYSPLPTSLLMKAGATKASMFRLLLVNYMCVHADLVSARLIYGGRFSESPNLLVTYTTIQNYPHPFSLPTSGYKIIHSIQHLDWYRHNDISTYTSVIKFDFVWAATNSMNISVYFAHGKIKKFTIQLVLIADSVLQTTTKKDLMFSYFTYPGWSSPLDIYTYDIPRSHDVLQNTFFIGFNKFSAHSINYHYQVYADPMDKKLKGKTYWSNSGLIYHGIAYYGYTCPQKYTFNEINFQCLPCPEYCISCFVDSANTVQCEGCQTNFNLSPDNLTCACNNTGMTIVANLCDDFVALNLTDCIVPSRVSGTIDCLFCSPQSFRHVKDNYCACMQGYDDNDADGLCQETCGDGLLFRAECDDGNLQNNDGCSSTCTFEPGFECDSSQPSFCRTLIPLRNKIASIEKMEGHSAKITFELANKPSDLPFPVEIHQLQPESIHLRLFLVTSDDPYQEIEITNVRIIDLEQLQSLTLQFDYNFAIEGLDARVVFNYSQTRYLKNSQEIKFAMKGSNAALTYTANLETYKTITIVICVATILSFVCLVFGLITPKFIGVEFLVTLQLIFYSQLLIVDTGKWPAGFLYLKYLKFASGYNDLLHLTSFGFFGSTSIKYSHLAMRKTICENFNINFVILLLSSLLFLIVHIIKLVSKKRLAETENGRTQVKKQEKPEFDKLIKELTEKYLFWCNWNDKAFWVVNNLSFWLILPILATIASQLVIDNSLVQIIQHSALTKLLISIGPIVAFVSLFIIFKVCLNNFSNMFLSQGAQKKALLRPEERTYKRLLFIYLLIVGTLVFLGNWIVIFKVPMSVLVLGLQVLYTISLIAIHPYKQSLKVHTITLLLNQALLIVFLVIINFINLFPDMDELLILMMGYFLTGCCGLLILLTVIRLYFELRYGEELEKRIQKERQHEEERLKKLKQEKLDMMKKKLESEAKKKQNAKEEKRSRNQYLYENQLKQDEASDFMQWLEKKNWEEEVKEKFYFERFAEKPLDWMQKNDKETFGKMMEARKEREKDRKPMQKSEQLKKLKDKLKKEGGKYVESWNRKVERHKQQLKSDTDYAMKMKKNESELLIQRSYQLKD